MIFVLRKKDKIGIIEKLGQKIPDPVIIFILLYILVLVVTGIFGGNTFSMTSADGTSVSYEIKNMFTAENIRWIFSNAILDNWLGYAGGIVGTILIVMFGIGIAEESGLLSALIRRMGTNISDKLLPFVLVFLGIFDFDTACRTFICRYRKKSAYRYGGGVCRRKCRIQCEFDTGNGC